jgi:hypothetical protein
MRVLLLTLALCCSYLPTVAAEEFLTSAFRITLPDDWKLRGGGKSLPIFDFAMRPNCEFYGRLYESDEKLLSLVWHANASYDTESGSEGPITPLASYREAVSSWAEKQKQKSLVDVQILDFAPSPPILKMTIVRGWMPKLKRQSLFLAALREDGFAAVELLTPAESKTDSLVDYLTLELSKPLEKQLIPTCKFVGKGSPALWSTWKNAPK